MLHAASPMAITAFWLVVGIGVSVAFYMARRGQSVGATPGETHWLVRGIAMGGEHISGAMLLGTCGLIAFYGYDGFLYAIGFVAGAFAALLIVAQPMSRQGGIKEALAARFPSREVRLAAATATVAVCLLMLSAELIAAGALLEPMLGRTLAGMVRQPRLLAGALAMVLTLMSDGNSKWWGFIKGILLVLICGGLAAALLARGFSAKPAATPPRILSTAEFRSQLAPTDMILPNTEIAWETCHFARVLHQNGSITLWRYSGMDRLELDWPAAAFTECQVVTLTPDDRQLINNQIPSVENELRLAGFVARLPFGDSTLKPASPLAFLATIQESNMGVPRSEVVSDEAGTHTIYFPAVVYGQDFLVPGQMPGLFPALGLRALPDRLNFVSLMLALFCGTAVAPSLMSRHNNAASNSGKAAAAGVGVIAVIFLLTLFLGLGALAAGCLNPRDTNATAILLAGSFGEPALVLFCTLGLALVAGTMRGLLATATQALGELLPATPHEQPRSQRKPEAVLVIAVLALAMALQNLNIAFLLGWAFNIAASALLPAFTLPLLWKKTTKRGIATSIFVGLVSSLVWILLSPDAFQFIYGYSFTQAARLSPVPFNQPALLTLPLAFLTLIVTSLIAPHRAAQD